MPSQSLTQTSFVQISDDLALFVSDSEALPPTVCPSLVPPGWELDESDPIDFTFANGDWVEVYPLRRSTT